MDEERKDETSEKGELLNNADNEQGGEAGAPLTLPLPLPPPPATAVEE